MSPWPVLDHGSQTLQWVFVFCNHTCDRFRLAIGLTHCEVMFNDSSWFYWWLKNGFLVPIDLEWGLMLYLRSLSFWHCLISVTTITATVECRTLTSVSQSHATVTSRAHNMKYCTIKQFVLLVKVLQCSVCGLSPSGIHSITDTSLRFDLDWIYPT